MHISLCICICLCANVYACIYTCIYIYMYVYTYMRIYIYICGRNLYVLYDALFCLPGRQIPHSHSPCGLKANASVCASWQVCTLSTSHSSAGKCPKQNRVQVSQSDSDLHLSTSVSVGLSLLATKSVRVRELGNQLRLFLSFVLAPALVGVERQR